MKNSAPQRVKMPNVHGRLMTLNSGEGAFVHYHAPKQAVQAELILGGCSLLSTEFFSTDKIVYYLENPTFENHLEQQNISWQAPTHWQKVQMKDVNQLMQNYNLHIWWFRQNLELDTDFWLPLLGQVLAKVQQAKTARVDSKKKLQKKVIIGCSEQGLLYAEVSEAFASLGFTAQRAQHAQQDVELQDAELFFSINLAGLSADGQDFALLQALNIPVVLWFVDNPWHVLSSLRLPWWKKAHIFVTDASFIATLRMEGAENVHHLPLAVAQHMWNTQQTQYRNESLQIIEAVQNAQCVFVGRASFPQKQGFFAALRLDENELEQGLTLLNEHKESPDFLWWLQKRHGTALPSKGTLWPGKDVRHVGLMAEECAKAQRVQWLKAMITVPSAIFGDSEAWQEALKGVDVSRARFCDVLDYYGILREVYAVAPQVLNVTSLLLPWGLTQRHFDVWAAGGFLWTNYTKGLDIFPQELTRHMAFASPDDFMRAMKNMPESTRQELKIGWKEELRNHHQYSQRMAFVLGQVLK